MGTDLVPDVSQPEDDALRSLLRRVTSYEKAGAPIPHAIWQFGFYGSLAVIASGVLAFILPAPTSVRHGGFFLIFGNVAASLDSAIASIAIPAIIVGVLLLGLNLWLLERRTSESWRAVVVLQAAAGGGGGTLCASFFVLVVLNLALWIAIIGLVVAAIGLMLSAAGS